MITQTTYISEPDGKRFSNADDCIAWERRNNPIYYDYEFTYTRDGKNYWGMSCGRNWKHAKRNHLLWSGDDLNKVENLKYKHSEKRNDCADPFSCYTLLEKAYNNPEWAMQKLEAYDWSWLEKTAEADKADCLQVIREKRMHSMDTLVRDLFFEILEGTAYDCTKTN